MQRVKELNYVGMILGFLSETLDNGQGKREYPVSHPQLGEVIYELELTTQQIYDNSNGCIEDRSRGILFISCIVDEKHFIASLQNPEKYINNPSKLQENIRRLDAWGKREGIQFP